MLPSRATIASQCYNAYKPRVTGLLSVQPTMNEGSRETPTTAGLDQQQIHRLWDSMIGAYVRADYFAHLANWYGRVEQGSRVLSGMFCFIAAFLVFREQQLADVAGLLAVVAGMVTMFELFLMLGDKRAEAVELHSSWNRLGIEYEALWSDSYRNDADQTLVELEERSAELSKKALRIPFSERRMTRRLARSAARVHPHFASVSSNA